MINSIIHYMYPVWITKESQIDFTPTPNYHYYKLLACMYNVDILYSEKSEKQCFNYSIKYGLIIYILYLVLS